MKILGIFLVLTGHILAPFCGHWGPYVLDAKGCERVFDFIYNTIYLFHMPLYFFISGFLFKLNDRKIFDKKWFIKKGRRLVGPFATCLLFVSIPIRYVTGYYEHSNIFYAYAETVKNNDVRHLWFLETLFAIYILTALAINIFKHKGEWVISVLMVVLWIVNCIGYDFVSIGKFSIFFGFGMLICRLKNRIKIKYISVLCSVLILLFFVLKRSVEIGWLDKIIDLILAMLIILLLYCISNKLSALIDKTIDREKINIFVGFSFGIYLFHEPVMYVIIKLIQNIDINVWSGVILLGGGAVAISMLIVLLIRKLKLGVLIGE